MADGIDELLLLIIAMLGIHTLMRLMIIRRHTRHVTTYIRRVF